MLNIRLDVRFDERRVLREMNRAARRHMLDAFYRARAALGADGAGIVIVPQPDTGDGTTLANVASVRFPSADVRRRFNAAASRILGAVLTINGGPNVPFMRFTPAWSSQWGTNQGKANSALVNLDRLAAVQRTSDGFLRLFVADAVTSNTAGEWMIQPGPQADAVWEHFNGADDLVSFDADPQPDPDPDAGGEDAASGAADAQRVAHLGEAGDTFATKGAEGRHGAA